MVPTEVMQQWQDLSHVLWPASFHAMICNAISEQMRIQDQISRQCLPPEGGKPLRPGRSHYRCRSCATVLGVCHASPLTLLGPLVHSFGHQEFCPSADLSGLAFLPNVAKPLYTAKALLAQATVDSFVQQLAAFLLNARQCRLPIPHKHNSRATLWNLSSLADMNTVIAKKKLTSISGYLAKGPVFLNETKWGSTSAMRAALQLHGASVFDSPAVLKAPSPSNRQTHMSAEHPLTPPPSIPWAASGGIRTSTNVWGGRCHFSYRPIP